MLGKINLLGYCCINKLIIFVCADFHLQWGPVINKMSAIKNGIIILFLINGNFVFHKYKDPTSKTLNSHDSFYNNNVDGLSCKLWSFVSKRHLTTNDCGIRKRLFPMRSDQHPW